MNTRKAYPSDLSDAEWQTIAPLLPPPAIRGRKRKYEMREIINAIFYQSKSGCEWRMLPHDLVPWESAYAYFAKLRDDGTFAHLNQVLARQVRVQEGHDPEPSAAIIDSQSVKTTQKGGTWLRRR